MMQRQHANHRTAKGTAALIAAGRHGLAGGARQGRMSFQHGGPFPHTEKERDASFAPRFFRLLFYTKCNIL